MKISEGWLTRCISVVSAWLRSGRRDVVLHPAPSIENVIVAPAKVQTKPRPRLLAAQIASVAKLNVPLGKKPRIGKVVSTQTKRPKPRMRPKTTAPVARSVHLQARHLVRKASLPSNVVPLHDPVKPGLAKTATKGAAKGSVRSLRLAA